MATLLPIDVVCVETLLACLAFGLRLIAMYDNGRTVVPWGGNIPIPDAFTSDPQKILEWLDIGFTRFAFVPGLAGLIVLDLDRKSGKDGLLALSRLILQKGIVLPWSIFTPPVWASTPSGGIHIFLRAPANFRCGCWSPAPGVDVIHWGHLAVAPGSAKFPAQGGNPLPYVLHGNLKDIPETPLGLLEIIRKPVKKYVLALPKVNGPRKSFDEMERILQRQGKDAHSVGRHVHMFHLAVFARNQGYSFTETLDHGLTLTEVYENPEESFLEDEVERTVASAFKGVRPPPNGPQGSEETSEEEEPAESDDGDFSEGDGHGE